jgi:tetratricopeptide (TPR) repeat protein
VRSAVPSTTAALLVRAARILLDGADGASSARGLELLARARAADPTNIDAALATARVWAALGKTPDVRALLSEVAEHHRAKKSPLLACVFLELGKAHLALDELVEAYDALKAGFAIDLRHAELAMLLGLVAIDLDDGKTAERALLAVATLPPKHEGGADRASAYYHLASMAHAKGDVVKARAWVGKAVTLDATHEGARALLERLEARSSGSLRTSAGGT